MTERRQGAPDPDEPVEFPEPSVRGAAFPQAGVTAQAEAPARPEAGAPAEGAGPADGGACARGAGPAEGGALMTDLGEVRRTDALFDALAERRAVVLPEGEDPSARTDPGRPGLPAGLAAPFTLPAASPKWALHDPDDPAVRLLSALIRDVDEPAPACRGTVPEPAGSPGPVGSAGLSRVPGPSDPADASDEADPAERCGPTGPTGPTGSPGPIATSGAPGSPDEDDRPQPPSGPRRRGPRTIVALGVAGAVLASTGVAAAGSGLGDQPPLGPGAAETAGDAGTSEAAEQDNSTALRPLAPVRPLPVSGPAESGSPRAAGESADRRRRAAIVRAKKALRDLRDGPTPRSRLPRPGSGWPWTALPVLGGDTGERTGRPHEDRDDEDRKRWRHRSGSPRDAHDRERHRDRDRRRDRD